jgi:hypothetical protein
MIGMTYGDGGATAEGKERRLGATYGDGPSPAVIGGTPK